MPFSNHLRPLRAFLSTLGLTAFTAFTAFASLAVAKPLAPLLTCQVTYAGATQTVLARPVSDPYSVPSVDIGGRFWFKPVMVGNTTHIARISLYAYLDATPQPLLIHQAKYLPPYPQPPQDGQALALTGQHHLYAGPLERELIYSCSLEGATP